MHIAELETPALLIDLDVMERNLACVADYAKAHHLRLRPHTKTHKTPELARRQLELGAAGLTVAKVGEAEVMLAAEPEDLLVAYPVIGGKKLDRLMEVARRTSVTVALDSVAAARQLSDAAVAAGVKVKVLVEADVGLGRVGVQPGEELLRLAQDIDSLPSLELTGLAFYPGHIKKMDADGESKVEALSAVVEGMVDDFKAAGLPTAVVSGGSTPTLFHSHKVRGMNEIRPGTSIFNDRNCVACGCSEVADCAASVLCTVVSTSRAGGMIIDGGSKTFSSDQLATGGKGFGLLVDAPQATFAKMNEEHGYVDLEAADGRFTIGDRVRMIPNHICVVVNLHERLYGIRGDTVVETWTVAGRGKLQ